MKLIRRILQLYETSGLSYRQMGDALNIPHTTVADYVRRYKTSGLTMSDLDEYSEREIYQTLFKDVAAATTTRPLPDFAMIHEELKRRHVTRLLLWEEYRAVNPEGLGYTQFCERYNRWCRKLSVTMRQVHKAGEKMFIDYSGLRMDIIGRQTGEVRKAEIFVACLGASGYSYAEASDSQKKASFINSHVKTFNFFGGVTTILVPDNLKSAVTKADYYEPRLNESYQDLAEHYGTAIIPARPYKPKDKAKVELSVKLVQRWILAKLRHRQFYSVAELNQAIRPLLDELNDRKILKLGKSRRELYEQLDRPALQPLPTQRYLYREFKLCRVNIDYHIQLERAYYSVPYQLTGKEVDVRYSESSVEVIYQNKRVAVHKRLYLPGSYSTKTEHMASAHRAYARWTPSRLLNWSKSFGVNTHILIETILTRKPHPEMGFRTCMGILNAARDMDKIEVEAVAGKMIALNIYQVSNFKAIVKNKSYRSEKPATVNTPGGNHENVRGQAYYR